MYVERIESIAKMVAGVAHGINTPLGVANTANGRIVSLVHDVVRTPSGPEQDDVVEDLLHSSEIMRKNIAQASNLARSFKELSTSQLSDERATTDLTGVITDCSDALSVEASKRDILLQRTWSTGARYPWIGYPGHLSQVLVILIQNAIRHAYPNGNGVIDIRVLEQSESYAIEVEDYGAGVHPDIHPQMFQPFVTSQRSTGASGLGLAIVQNIVTTYLKGRVSCTSTLGRGSKFVVQIPRVTPA
jgi:signal transduction histidine kinase